MTFPETRALRTGVLVTRRYPSYKDVPGVRYHYPKARYQRAIQNLVGCFVLFYEPRRGGDAPEAAIGGRIAFVGGAFIESISDDPDDPTHGYAHFRYAIDFTTAVPVQRTNVSAKALQSAVLEVASTEVERILAMGLTVDSPLTISSERYGLTDVPDLTHLPARPLTQVTLNRRIRDQAFRYRVVEKIYDGTCAFTGIRMTNGEGRAEADAAHIVPVEENGPDTVRNGIALMKSVHWAFDRGLVSLTDDGKILSVERSLDAGLERLLLPGRMARLPAAQDERPHPTFLAWHRKNRFKGSLAVV